MNTTTESHNRKEILSTLESVIQVSRDGTEGFRQASEHAEAGELKIMFGKYAAERAVMVIELQALQREHGQADVDDSGTIAGGLHRAWINLRSIIGTKNDQAILEEAVRGEEAALKAYRDALLPITPSLPQAVIDKLSEHLKKVEAAHEDVRSCLVSNRYDVKQS